MYGENHLGHKQVYNIQYAHLLKSGTKEEYYGICGTSFYDVHAYSYDDNPTGKETYW